MNEIFLSIHLGDTFQVRFLFLRSAAHINIIILNYINIILNYINIIFYTVQLAILFIGSPETEGCRSGKSRDILLRRGMKVCIGKFAYLSRWHHTFHM